jgi:transposase
MGKKISESVKQEAIRLVEGHGVKVVQVCKELGVSRPALDRWLKEYRTSASNGLTIDEKAELRRLRAENRMLKLEKDLLKKATVYFAKHSE